MTFCRCATPVVPTSATRVTSEATVENGQIRLSESVRLPERAKVSVLVPGVEDKQRSHIASPRLARAECAADFVKEVTEEPRDAAF